MKKAEQTQWAATYLVAAELTRRDYSVFVRVDPDPLKPADFFILSHQDLIDLHKSLTLTFPSVTRKGEPYKEFAPGFRPSDLSPHKGDWQSVPD